MGPAGLYSDLQPGRIGELEGQSSAGTWPRSHSLPTCPCGARDSRGRAWEDRTLQPPRWDSNPHGQPCTHTDNLAPSVKEPRRSGRRQPAPIRKMASRPDETTQTDRTDKLFNPSCKVGGICPEVTLPPIGRVVCRWPAPRRGSVVVSDLLASHWLERLGFARSSSIGWRKHFLPFFGAEPRSEATEAPPMPSAKNTIMESVREGLVGWRNEAGCCC